MLYKYPARVVPGTFGVSESPTTEYSEYHTLQTRPYFKPRASLENLDKFADCSMLAD
jgi:hypothetical protein